SWCQSPVNKTGVRAKLVSEVGDRRRACSHTRPALVPTQRSYLLNALASSRHLSPAHSLPTHLIASYPQPATEVVDQRFQSRRFVFWHTTLQRFHLRLDLL